MNLLKRLCSNFYSITPECTFNERLESVVAVYENILQIPEKERIT